MNENNLNNIIIKKMKILFYNESTNELEEISEALKLFSRIKRIFSSPQTSKAFLYFLRKDAATALMLQVDLKLPEATAHRVIKNLRRQGFLEPEMKIRTKTRGGPRPTIWVLPGASNKSVADAHLLHMRMVSPKFRAAEKVKQITLETCMDDELISFIDVVSYARDLGHRRQESVDIADMACRLLIEEGKAILR